MLYNKNIKLSRTKKAAALLLYFVLLFSFCLVSCKTKKVVASTATAVVVAPIQDKNLPIASGKVSHQYSSSGCGTVIFCDKINGQDSLIFIPIPMGSLNAFDVDGLEITFNYRMLKIRNPRGCMHGSPIQISNISKK
ncbi:MAG TPA: hypothetical protein VNG53_09445 [Bacteroidia bacterium]|nr:hypothetical protein [Bacteroidia bacterium]